MWFSPHHHPLFFLKFTMQGFPSLELFKQKRVLAGAAQKGFLAQREAGWVALRQARSGFELQARDTCGCQASVWSVCRLPGAADCGAVPGPVLSPSRCSREGFPVLLMSLGACQVHMFLEGLCTAWGWGLAVWAAGFTNTGLQGVWTVTPLPLLSRPYS